MSPDPLVDQRANLARPQRWNRYSYALNNPLKYVDPDGLDIQVATSARSAVAYAYRTSQTFRRQFDAAKSNPNVQVKLQLAPKVYDDKGRQVRAKFDGDAIPINPVVNGSGKLISSDGYKVVGTLTIAARGDAESGARTGHEIAHINDALDFGGPEEGTWQYDELESRADGVESEIRDDYRDESDDLCGGAADQALEGTGNLKGSGASSGFDAIRGYMAAAEARKKELEAQGKW